jgi:LysR substrate binding domain
MVTLTRASKLRSTLETACQAAGFDPRIVAETSDLGVMVELAAEQLGVAVLPASGLAGAAALVQLRLTQPKLDRRLLLVWRPAASPPAARAFLALARRHLTHRRATPDQPGHSPRRLVTQYTVVLMTADRAREQQPRQHGPDHRVVGDPGESALGSDSSATGTSSACDSVRGGLGSLVELAQPHVHDAGANRGLELAGGALGDHPAVTDGAHQASRTPSMRRTAVTSGVSGRTREGRGPAGPGRPGWRGGRRGRRRSRIRCWRGRARRRPG